MRAVAEKLTPAIVAMGSVCAAGTRDADFVPHDATNAAFAGRLCELLADHDDDVLAAYVDDCTGVPYPTLRSALAVHTGRARVHPVFFGSAITGAGVHHADRSDHRAAACCKRRRRGADVGHRVQSGSWAGRREDRLHPPIHRFGADTGPSAGARRARAHRDGHPGLRNRLDRAAYHRRSREDRETVGTRGCPHRRHDRCASDGRGAAPFRTADAGNGDRPAPPTRQRRAAGGAGPTRRTGSADQSAAGRYAAGTLRFTVRRSAEGGHPRHAGRPRSASTSSFARPRPSASNGRSVPVPPSR